jgi:hypothetical protein
MTAMEKLARRDKFEFLVFEVEMTPLALRNVIKATTLQVEMIPVTLVVSFPAHYMMVSLLEDLITEVKSGEKCVLTSPVVQQGQHIPQY